ncbi:ubiquitin carboxyl-terminal hydrolase BAP1-like [Oppia nitens]|uniref:ubiquitin carboxyl-terminal hydrolase BAP1-like n=1 Tax=Oppia nitens TaxID=1686743 RepID=UPI0023D9AE31|nr:ubiquitin carboxyl-terminal hydrolase BAP1-like [Oppia nitens]
MPHELYRLSEGWLELESDPGLFTLLLEDFGCKGIQVEEIYDLAKPIEGTVFGFIFLFKWVEEQRRGRWRMRAEQNGSAVGSQTPDVIENEELVNQMFFAQQMVPNSCATHALLSVLLNCPHIQLGSVLHRFQKDTQFMSPENKGYAIGNCPELARAHNSHAAHCHDISSENRFGSSSRQTNLTATQRSQSIDAFHFASYVPINGRLIELDGLKRWPIDHGSIEDEYWTEKFRRVIRQRLERETQPSEGNDIRYNLMAVVPDKRVNYLTKLNILKTNRHIVLEALQEITRPTRLPTPLDYHNYSKYPEIDIKPQNEFLEDNNKTNGNHNNQNINYQINDTIDNMDNNSNEIREPLTISINEENVRNDLRLPLSIQTSISPTPSSSSSTDTSSEIGSAFNSPNNTSCDNLDERINQMFVCKLFNNRKSKSDQSPVFNEHPIKSPSNHNSQPLPSLPSPSVTCITNHSSSSSLVSPNLSLTTPSKAFTAVDLVALLKNLEVDIQSTETNLKEELEKRRKYRIDDSRRTHNYDTFITTFLTMLAERGQLADLIERDLGVNTSISNCTPNEQKRLNSTQVVPQTLITSIKSSMSNNNSNNISNNNNII